MPTDGPLGSSTRSRDRCPNSNVGRRVNSKNGCRWNDFLPDTNACIALLRQKNPAVIARWHGTRARDIALCSIVAYELRYGAERAANPTVEHAKLDVFLRAFGALSFDEPCAMRCAQIRHALERTGMSIGPHDLQIAAIAAVHGLTLVTHNLREFSRIPGLKLEDWEP